MNTNDHSGEPNPPRNITPLNGKHGPNGHIHPNGQTPSANTGSTPFDFSDFEELSDDDLRDFQANSNAGVSPAAPQKRELAASFDDAQREEGLVAAGSATGAELEPLPSAGFLTPDRIAHYSKLAEAPRLDLDYIKAEARGGSANGETKVADHHRHLCQMARGGFRHTLEKKRESVLANLGHLRDDILRTRRMLKATRQFDDIPGAQPTLVWSWSDRLAAWLLALFAVAGVVVDFCTWATVLCLNNPHFYHNPVLAVFFGAIPLALPLSIKLLLDDGSDAHGCHGTQRKAAWFGVIACIATIVLFVAGNDGVGESMRTGFGSLRESSAQVENVNWKPVIQKAGSVFLMVASAIFSALCGHLFMGMFKRRRRSDRVANPQYTITSRQLAKLQFISQQENETLGAIDGKLKELASEESALIGSAVNYFMALRNAFANSQRQIAELMDAPDAPPVRSKWSTKKGMHFLGMIIAALALSGLVTGCGRTAPAISASQAAPSQIVVGLSPALPIEEGEKVFGAISELVLNNLPNGGTLEVWDAFALRRVMVVSIPDDSFYSNPSARQPLVAQKMAELKHWLAAAGATSGASPIILLPQFIATVSRGQQGPSMAILLVGSALYAHPRDTAWNLVGNVFYTDGHLAAAPELSPFSVQGREHSLASAALYYAYVRDEFASEAQREGLTRFYAIWAKSMGGALSCFSPDVAVAFDRLTHGIRTPILEPKLHDDEEKPELREIRTERTESVCPQTPIPVNTEQHNALSLTDQMFVPLSESEMRATPPLATPIVSTLTIMARWQAHVDVDLYASPGPGEAELYYGHPSTPEGEFHKDWQDAPPEGSCGFEIVSFHRPTDLRNLRIALNLYKGDAPKGVEVEVRMIVGNSRFEQTFHIDATRGNRGANSAGRIQDPHWVVITQDQIAGMCGLKR